MTTRLALQRCWNHSGREAVARCPECSRFFCRECVVEHEDRVICSGCLAKIEQPAAKPKRKLGLGPIFRLGAAFAGLMIAWLTFFSVGRLLLEIPDEFHAGTLWERTFTDDFTEGMEDTEDNEE